MKNKDRIHRIKLLEERHKKLHDTINSLEAEKAPGVYIKKAKVEKLKLKDEINYLDKLKTNS
jgi:hypothetical protein